MFQNRSEAGQLLASKLTKYKDSKNVIVLAIPRGGVVVGREIAVRLHLPLSVVVVKKLGAPNNSELAIGAVAVNGAKYIDELLVERLDVGQDYLADEIRTKIREAKEREKILGIQNLESRIQNYNYKRIILVDDGIATGATILAAIRYIKGLESKVWRLGFEINRERKNRSLVTNRYSLNPIIILAVPVIAKESFDRLKSEVDEIVALEVHEDFGAVGQFYRDFPQVEDEEVIKILSKLNNLTCL